jgi:hypothetical protein
MLINHPLPLSAWVKNKNYPYLAQITDNRVADKQHKQIYFARYTDESQTVSGICYDEIEVVYDAPVYLMGARVAVVGWSYVFVVREIRVTSHGEIEYVLGRNGMKGMRFAAPEIYLPCKDL